MFIWYFRALWTMRAIRASSTFTSTRLSSGSGSAALSWGWARLSRSCQIRRPRRRAAKESMEQKQSRKGPPLRKYAANDRFYNGIVLAILLLIPLLGYADTDREKSVGSHLMCICGCQQVLTECNHIHCPSSVPMRAELHDKMAAGMTDDQVYAAFVSKY